MADAPESYEVLVALLPEPRDLELARERGWYRVRQAELAERIRGGLDQFGHLAFYQPDSFGPERRCVRYYAPILGRNRATRRELLPEEPDQPRAEQLYLRFDLGPLEEVARPIPASRGRRVLFIPTSWRRLALAEELNELFAGTPIEELLYRRLRELGLFPEREWPVTLLDPDRRSRRPRHYFLDLALFCQQRNLDVECDGDSWHARRDRIPADNERHNLLEANRWHVMHFNTVQLRDKTEDTLALIREAVNRYGGALEPSGVVRRFRADGALGPGQGRLDFG